MNSTTEAINSELLFDNLDLSDVGNNCVSIKLHFMKLQSGYWNFLIIIEKWVLKLSTEQRIEDKEIKRFIK